MTEIAPAGRWRRWEVITVEVERVSDSCGYAVPLMDFRAERDLLLTSHSRRSTDDLAVYRAAKNAASIDGLPVF
ncbi:hypothetical protein AB0C06_18435 [Micromonospora inaquosa]|uniref:hypothetical protein n=1 Tax=Micromonospora inaquosa TaxID=2203716 RepID=UPI001FCA07B4|nr:hypothetical protein [Micromonospora inaquosa]